MRPSCVPVFVALLFCLTVSPSAIAQDLGGWVAPEEGWDYVYEANEDEDVDGEFAIIVDPLHSGFSLDETWTHSNGSDAWDGSGPGDEFRPDGFTRAAPGGAGIVIVPGAGEGGGDAEVLSIVDIGDPRSLGFSDPSNRKTWFCHDMFAHEEIDATNALASGITLIIRSRLHPDIDPDTPGHQLPDGGVDDDAGQGVAPGYTIRDGGKGGHGFYDSGLDRNFTMVPWGTRGYQLPPQVGEGLPPANFLDIGDNTVFHSFWVTIEDPDFNDRYTVTVYVDGSIEPAAIFEDIPVGDDTDCDGINHLHMGFHSTPQKGGIQIDYFGYKIGVHEPESFCPGGFAAEFNEENGQVTLSWAAGAVDSYTLVENGVEIQTGIAADTTSFTVTDPARPTARYELRSVGGDCAAPSVTVTTVVCPELSCTTDSPNGEVTLEWTDAGFFTATGFTILRDGVEAGTVDGSARSFSDSPDPGEHTYQLRVASDPAGSCPSNPFCNVRLFGPGAIDVSGDAWERVVFNGVAQPVTTTDGVRSLYFPGGAKTEGDIAAFAVQVDALGDGELDSGRYRVEIRARYDNEVRIVNRSSDPETFVQFNLSRTGVSTATDEIGQQEVVEQVPSPPGGPTVDSAASTIVNTDTTVGLELVEGLNLIEIRPVDGGGFPHDDQIQVLELRIGPFADGLVASIVDFPCPAGLSCVKRLDGKVELSWSAGDPHSYEILRDDVLVTEIPMGNTTSFVDDPGDGFFTYTLRTTDDESCPDQTCTGGGGVPDLEGFIREWLILGPLDWFCVSGGGRSCANPGVADIERDYLRGSVDGESVNEADIMPSPGTEILLDDQAAVKPTARDDINPNAPDTATWFLYSSGGPDVDHNVVFGGDPGNDYMVYNCTYIENVTDDPIDTNIEVASDDSVQVYVNDLSVWTNNIARGLNVLGGDFVPGIRLEPGLNRILVKVFEGGGDTGLVLRFVDDFFTPLTEVDGLRVRIAPGPIQPPRPLFRRGDTTQDGELNITDAVKLFGILFLGDPDISCQEAKDVNNDSEINITDGIRVLGFLFLGQPPPSAPGHIDCGADPDEPGSRGDLGCEAHPPCE